MPKLSTYTKAYKTVGPTGALADYTCDGTADDVQIQAAVTAVGNAGGGTVFIMAGTYDITETILIPSKVTIRGAGWATLLQSSDNTNVVLKNTSVGANNVDINLYDFAVDGDNTTTSITAADGTILFDNVVGGVISGIKCTNNTKEGIKARASKYISISNCYVNWTPAGGAGIIFATDSTNCSMSNNIAIDCGGEAFGCYYAHYCTIVGNTSNTLTSGQRGHILLESSAADPSLGHTVSGNTVVADYYGINVISGSGHAITGNSVTHFSTSALSGINIDGASKYIAVVGNNIRNIARHGIAVIATSSKLTVSGNVIINPSMATANTYDGIYVAPAGGNIQDIVINGNLTTDDQGTKTMRNGIYLNAGAQVITNASTNSNLSVGHLTAAFAKSGTITTPSVNVMGNMTTTQKEALSGLNGMLVYDSTLNKFQGYENGSWTNLI